MPAPRAKPNGVLIYLAILATVYVVASLVLGGLNYQSVQSTYQSVQSNARKIERLQRDTNDNLCNQQAYSGGTSCAGG